MMISFRQLKKFWMSSKYINFDLDRYNFIWNLEVNVNHNLTLEPLNQEPLTVFKGHIVKKHNIAGRKNQLKKEPEGRILYKSNLKTWSFLVGCSICKSYRSRGPRNARFRPLP